MTRRRAGRSRTRRTTACASWVAVSVIIVGFVVGGVALVPHPHWWLFWIGAGIVVVGGIMGAAAHILDDWY